MNKGNSQAYSFYCLLQGVWDLIKIRFCELNDSALIGVYSDQDNIATGATDRKENIEIYLSNISDVFIYCSQNIINRFGKLPSPEELTLETIYHELAHIVMNTKNEDYADNLAKFLMKFEEDINEKR